MYVGSISMKAKETPKAGQDDTIGAVYALVRERSDALGDISPPICAALSPRPTGLLGITFALLPRLLYIYILSTSDIFGFYTCVTK